MANTNFDELHTLAKPEQKKRKSMPFEQYFGEMEISEEQKKRRIALAEQIMIIFLMYFVRFADEDDYGDYEAMIVEKFTEVANGYMGLAVATAYITDHARKLAEEVTEVTERRAEEDEYWTSEDRATLIAEEQANYIAEYDELVDAVRDGCTLKTWHTMQDNRVRDTHVAVDGQTISVFDPFVLDGGELMFPGDDSLGVDPSELVNCRCHCTYT